MQAGGDVNKLERHSLVDRIGRELQARMGYTDIDIYLGGHGVDVKKPTSGINSKWVYAKERLSDAPDDLVVRIADELNLPHEYVTTPQAGVVEATFWHPQYFRLFVSHLSSYKKKTAALQTALLEYGVSAFVAHVDIEPTREWQDEIELGLASMDALAAVLMPGFKESNWTDQEVGYALGRGVLIIPIIRGLNPHGFIGKYQGFHADGKSVAQVAHGVFRILVTSPGTRNRMLKCLIAATANSGDEDEAVRRLGHVEGIEAMPTAYLEQLSNLARTSTTLSRGRALEKLNALLQSRGLSMVTNASDGFEANDDLPF